MALQDLFTHVLNFLRDPIWQGLGVLVAIIIALIPTIYNSTSPFSLVTVKKTFQSMAIPLLASSGIVAILWRQIEVAIILNMLVITVFFVKRRKHDDENIKANNSDEIGTKKNSHPDNLRYIKPPKR